MNTEFKLKLQAYVDGELPEPAAREVEAGIKSVPEAEALLEELRFTRAALRGNEPEWTLPETREFYWSKIERAILAEERAASPRRHPFSWTWLRRYWPQLSGAGVAAVLLIVAALQINWSAPQVWEDVESPLADTSTFWFRSEPDKLTLVWVSDVTPEETEQPDTIN